MFHAKAIINKMNLIHNINYIRKYVGPNVSIMPVVKANAYGHGVVQICQILSKHNVQGFCVSLLNEVIQIRDNEIDSMILHLGSIKHEFNPILLDKNLILTVNSNDDVHFLNEIGKANNHKFRVHIKIDTGMTRLGILREEMEKIKVSLYESDFLVVEGVYSQLSSADEDDESITIKQREVFIDISNYFCSHFSSIKFKHLTPSAGLLKNKDNHFNMVRPGISLYGVNNVSEQHPLKPVLCLKAPVCLVKNVKKGSSIGANATIICGNNIGKFSLIGAGAVVTKSVKKHRILSNAIQKRSWPQAPRVSPWPQGPTGWASLF